MKRWIILLLVGLLAACAPGPREPVPLAPVAPETTAPETTMPETTVPEMETAAPLPPEEPEVTVVPTPPAEAPATEEPATPTEEPTITVIPAEPEGEADAPETATPETAAPETVEPETAVPEAEAPSATSGGGTIVTDPEDPGISATISISADNQTFVSAEEESQNPVTVAAGGTFYLRINATDPEGITGAAVELRNSDAAGTLPTGPFTVASSDCEAQVASVPTELTCTVAVTIAPDATNIQQEGEMAYAFRPRITDAAGNTDLAYSWGYLIVQ